MKICWITFFRSFVSGNDRILTPKGTLFAENSRYKFSIGARKFVTNWNSHGPAHHCAVGIDHISSKIEKLGKLLNVEVVKVC
jgi:L-arabinose isomerase